MSKRPHPTIALSARLIELDGAAPTEFRLLPVGQFKAKDGRPQGLPGWVMNDANAAAILSAASAQQDKFLIDYDHQTLHSKTNGQPAPAAGWFGRMEWRPGDGLFATDIEWTAAARAAIEAHEYRYISPVLKYDPKTGDVTGVIMAALVNYAALDGLTDLAAAAALLFSTQPQENSMDKELLALLGLSETADKAAVLAAITALKAGTDQVAALSAQVEALKAKSPDPAKFVPIDAVAALQTQLAELSATVSADKISKLIEPALADGRLLPAQKAWAESLGKSDIAALSAYLDTARPIAALDGMQTRGKAPAAIDKTLPVETRAKAEFEASAALQAEFDTADTYVAYCRANESGAVKILGGND
jgi:phage I-like protein